MISAQANAEQNQAYETHAITQHQKFEADSADAQSVVKWLRQREAEGQFSEYLDPQAPLSGTITLDSVSTIKLPLGNDESVIRGGGSPLPPTGTPGQVITITTCTPGLKVTETWTWIIDSSGKGSWQLTDVSTHQSKDVCVGGN